MLRSSGTKSHVEEIFHAVEDGNTYRDQYVVDSWNRCLNEHSLDPEVHIEARIVTQSRLRHHQQEVEEFLRMARYGLEDLYRRVDSMGYVLLLTDAKGVTVDFIGDHKVDQELKNAGLYLGAQWTEKESGTCGVGACLATGEAMVIHQTDHFDVTHTPLSCTAAPIYDVKGVLIGVLDVSLLSSPTDKYSQALTLEVVKSCVRRIEQANLLCQHRSDTIVQLSPSPEFLEVDPNCSFALAQDGTISGMTHGAQRVLADSISVDWRNPKSLLGRRFEDFFDFDLNKLPELTRTSDAAEKILITKKNGIAYANVLLPVKPNTPYVTKQNIPSPLQRTHGGDATLQQLCEKAAKIVDKRISVVLHGETGVGKEFVAKAMHQSRKQKGPFVAINCAALPENLIESELFGYAPNSFTGASAKGKTGLIEQANGGSLFLDEIGDMPLTLQARLLRVLSEREVQPVGSTRAIPVNIHVISASHKDLNSLVKNGQFRQDLFYRLNGIVLEIPPVREREDKHWLFRQVASNIRVDEAEMNMSNEVFAALCAYDWPGNVREIFNVLELCSALYNDVELTLSDLPTMISASHLATGVSDKSIDIKSVSEYDDIVSLLSQVNWNISAAARKLGVDRTTLYRRMNKLKIVSPNHRG